MQEKRMADEHFAKINEVSGGKRERLAIGKQRPDQGDVEAGSRDINGGLRE